MCSQCSLEKLTIQRRRRPNILDYHINTQYIAYSQVEYPRPTFGKNNNTMLIALLFPFTTV